MSDDPTHTFRLSSSETCIPMNELADELGLHRGSIFKIAKRLEIQPIKRRDPDRGNQVTHLVTEEQASAIRTEVAGRRRGNRALRSDALEFASDDGWFYLIQLEPEFDPGRVKVGFTTDLDGRLQKHRCSAPFATYHKHWPCRRTWERTAIDCLTAEVEQLHTEVFRSSSVQEIASRGDQFFNLMPKVTASLESDDLPEDDG